MTDILDERGLFWWADTKVPPTRFAPDDAVAGRLTINEEGRIRVELDGVLPSEAGPFGALTEPTPTRGIAGLLKSDNRYILATTLHRAGGRWSSNGISFDAFSALECLVSSKILPSRIKVRSVDFDMAGYEEWLRLGEVKKSRTKRTLTIKQTNTAPLRYRGEAGTLRLTREMANAEHGYFGSRGLDLREVAWMRFTPRKSLELKAASECHGIMQELLILLTDSDFRQAWPELILTTGQQCKLFHFRQRTTAKPPEWLDCITNFIELEDRFGDLFFAWLKKRIELGPAAYLYMATRRGVQMYSENQFTSLIVGLETLHRTLTGDPPNPAFTAKMASILADIENKADREWLRKRTKNFGAPSLEQRLMALFESIPARVDKKSLRAFCNACAALRNSFSHHGHATDLATASNGLQQLAMKNAVIGFFYHAKLLLEIGMPAELVERWLNDSRQSHQIKWYMDRAGLKATPEKAAPVSR